MNAAARAAKVRFLFLDVDGVMTDGKIYLSPGGEQTRAFDVRDGVGIKMLLAAGVEVGFISGGGGESIAARAKMLGVVRVHREVADKLDIVRRALAEADAPPQAAGFVGDDLPDIAAMRYAGFAAAPADAHPRARACAHFVTKAKGGGGAVREVCERILRGRR
jgi:3-deoxy-D-manno-octulosonate 8-phosphate phosphatase (KDO 8-P phosphatase)